MKKDTYDTGATRHSDNNEERFDLISPYALKRLSKIYAEGAESHGERNWEKGLPKKSTVQHLLWHWNRYQSGDTSQDHLAKVMWGIATLLHFEEVGNPAEPVEVHVHGVLNESRGKHLKYGGHDA